MKQYNDRRQNQTKAIQVVSTEVRAASHRTASRLPKKMIASRHCPDKTHLYTVAESSSMRLKHPGVLCSELFNARPISEGL
jgi:hypothetical protein